MVVASRVLGLLAGLVLAAPAAPQEAGAEPLVDKTADQTADEPTVVLMDEGAFDGYTLFAPLRSRTTYLIDMQGAVVHTWESELPPGQSVYLTDDGRLFRAGRLAHPLFHGGGQGGRLQEFDWDGDLLWDVTLSNATHHAHHDFELLPNGNLLVLAWEALTPDDAFQAGRLPEAIHAEEGFWPDALFELKPLRPDGFEVVWEWAAKDHLVQDIDPERGNFGTVLDNPARFDVNYDVRDAAPLTAEERRAQEELDAQMRALGYTGGDAPTDDEGDVPKKADWMHSNGVDYHAAYDLILVSSRALSEVFVIDHSTTTEEARGSEGGRWGRGGDLLYRWGNPANYGLGDASTQTLFVQHDASWLETDDGSLRFLVYDNGADRPGGADFSEVEEVRLPFHPERGFRRDPGQPFEPDAPSWSYGSADEARFFSPFVSGVQRLPNGNTLICSGVEGRVFEVTRAGEIVWDFRNPFGGEVSLMEPHGDQPEGAGPPDALARHGLFRATRLAVDHPGLARLRN